MSDAEMKMPSRLRKNLLKMMVIVLLITAAALLISDPRVQSFIKISNVEELQSTVAMIKIELEKIGILAPIVFLLLYFLIPVFLLPISPLPMAGGMLFGPIWGSLLSITGGIGAALLSFYIARYLARDTIASLLQGKLSRIEDISYEHGIWAVLFIRLIGLPFGVQNYLGGLANVRFRDYLLGSLMGITPWTIAISMLGDSLATINKGMMLAASIIMLLVYLIFFLLFKVVQRKVKTNYIDTEISYDQSE